MAELQDDYLVQPLNNEWDFGETAAISTVTIKAKVQRTAGASNGYVKLGWKSAYFSNEIMISAANEWQVVEYEMPLNPETGLAWFGSEMLYGNPEVNLIIEPGDGIIKCTQLWAEVDYALPDEEAPVVTILGDNPYTLVQGTEWVDPGATALDNIDGDVTANIFTEWEWPEHDLNIIGEYHLIYICPDSAGNYGWADRAIYVVEQTEPEPTVKKKNSFKIIFY